MPHHRHRHHSESSEESGCNRGPPGPRGKRGCPGPVGLPGPAGPVRTGPLAFSSGPLTGQVALSFMTITQPQVGLTFGAGTYSLLSGGLPLVAADDLLVGSYALPVAYTGTLSQLTVAVRVNFSNGTFSAPVNQVFRFSVLRDVMPTTTNGTQVTLPTFTEIATLDVSVTYPSPASTTTVTQNSGYLDLSSLTVNRGDILGIAVRVYTSGTLPNDASPNLSFSARID